MSKGAAQRAAIAANDHKAAELQGGCPKCGRSMAGSPYRVCKGCAASAKSRDIGYVKATGGSLAVTRDEKDRIAVRE